MSWSHTVKTDKDVVYFGRSGCENKQKRKGVRARLFVTGGLCGDMNALQLSANGI